MGYQHIDNLYKCFHKWAGEKMVYAMEKIHGTSAHIKWDGANITLFSGGEKMSNFEALFDLNALRERFGKYPPITVFGEAYGAKILKMSETYGRPLRFIVFDVLNPAISATGSVWHDVPAAHAIATDLGLEFVDYALIPCELEHLDRERDRPSVQAFRNGVGDNKTREGIVIRPIVEKYIGQDRLIAKHKGAAFCETVGHKTKPVDMEKLAVLKKADEVAKEWVTPMRLTHILNNRDLMPGMIPELIGLMCDDIEREGAGEIFMVDGKLPRETRKAIGHATAVLVKKELHEAMAAGMKQASM